MSDREAERAAGGDGGDGRDVTGRSVSATRSSPAEPCASAGRSDAWPDGRPDVSPEVWLFGYGSLIWRPDVAFDARAPAVLRGYERRFWQRSTDHRGTVERPGRVVTLVPRAGARVVGVAYRLVAPAATLERVDVREQQGYTRAALPIELAGERGRSRTAVVYVADPANPYFAGDEAIEHTAAIVAAAHGPSGANLEYARALVAALAELVTAHGEELALSAADLGYERDLLAHAERHHAERAGTAGLGGAAGPMSPAGLMRPPGAMAR